MRFPAAGSCWGKCAAYWKRERDTLVQLQRQGQRALAVLTALLLAFSLVGVTPSAALADPVDDGQAAVDQAQATLSDAEARMAQINEEYEALSAQVDELQGKIDETSASALEAQQAMLEGRENLGDVAVGEYRNGSAASLLMMVLDSKSFADLLRNMEYATQIMAFQADEIAKQEERKRAFDEVSNELNTQKNEQEQALAAQAEKRAEAEAIVDDAASRLESAKADHAARLAELAAQAEALRKQQEEAEAAAARKAAKESPDANTGDREPVVGDDAPVEPDPDDGGDEGSSGDDSSSGDSGESEGEADTSDDNAGSSDDEEGSAGSFDTSNEGWLSGTASAYGGKTDPSTPNPGTTATGAVCDDNSMGVAVPKSLKNYRSYFGRTVEIKYGGKTVYATVNDCGSMGGGSRVLDLQPGVWKAFGFSSCKGWGLRTVKYRFL